MDRAGNRIVAASSWGADPASLCATRGSDACPRFVASRSEECKKTRYAQNIEVVSPSSTATGHQLADIVIHAAKLATLSEKHLWQRLLHYMPVGANGEVESEADGTGFFFAPTGKTDPKAELESTIRAMLAPYTGAKDGHPVCRFPARWSFIAEQLDFVHRGIRAPACPALAKWYDAIRPSGVTMIFADASIGSPASMYGHTLLRIDRRGAAGNPLLSTAVNYSAFPTTTNPLLYTLFGLTGGFPGRFTALPYYIKVQEYSNFNARNLWEYRLDLKPRELHRLLLHIFEMEQTHFDYFYLTENCSYHLLSLLEVARPSLDLRSAFGPYVIPVDTVLSILNVDGLVAERVFRPSQDARMSARYETLNSDEIDIAENLATSMRMDFTHLVSLPQARQAAVLDSAHDYLRYLYGHVLETKDSEDAEFANARERDLLQRRAAIDVLTGLPGVEEPPAPETGHGVSRMAFSAARLDGVDSLGFGLRLSLHDILDPQAGFIENGQIAFPELRFRITPKRMKQPEDQVNSIVLDRIDIVNIMSVTPARGWIRKPSWRLRLGGGVVEDLGCSRWNCVAADISGGPGYALGYGHQVLYGFTDAYADVGPAFSPGYRLGAGAALGVIVQLHKNLRMQAEARYRYNFSGDTSAGAGFVRFFVAGQYSMTKDLGIRLSFQQVRSHGQSTVALHYYY